MLEGRWQGGKKRSDSEVRRTPAGQLVAFDPMMRALVAAALPLLAASSSVLPVQCTTCVHPAHSWATMPVSFHSARDASKALGEFTAADMATIAKFPLATIEKWQGSLATDASNRSVFLWEEDAM